MIIKKLEERGHSDPEKGLKVINQFQLPTNAQHLFDKIEAGDSYTKRHLITEINHSFEQWAAEGRVDMPLIGKFVVRETDMDWARSMVATHNTVELRGMVTQDYLVRGDYVSQRLPFTCLYYPEHGYVADIDIQGQWY